MNKPVSAKYFSRILNDLRQFSIKMRRSRKYNWKKGGVDCRVSRRGRDFPRITRICPQSRCNYCSYREDTFLLTRNDCRVSRSAMKTIRMAIIAMSLLSIISIAPATIPRAHADLGTEMWLNQAYA